MAKIESGDKDAFDDGAKPFDFGAEADLFPAKGRMSRRPVIGYRRFVRAADAVRFAIEQLPATLLAGTYLEVDESRFDGQAIRRLYDSEKYPHARRAAA